MALSCEEIHEQITAYVDDRVDKDAYRQKVAAHIESCSACRDEYEREIMTKMVIRQRFPRIGTPSELRSIVEEGFDTVSRTASGVRRGSGSSRSRRKSAQGPIFLLLLVIAGLATYILLFKDSDPAPQSAQTQTQPTQRRTPVSAPTRRSTGPINPFNLAIGNYEQVRAGRFELNPETGDLAQLKSAFNGQGVSSLTFAGVSLPLKGGRVIAQGGIPIPHLVYGDDKVTLYLYEISWENLQNGKGVSVTEDVAQKLTGGEPVWVPVSSDANLVMYKNGDAVEVVVANRPQGEIKRLLGLPA